MIAVTKLAKSGAGIGVKGGGDGVGAYDIGAVIVIEVRPVVVEVVCALRYIGPQGSALERADTLRVAYICV